MMGQYGKLWKSEVYKKNNEGLSMVSCGMPYSNFIAPYLSNFFLICWD